MFPVAFNEMKPIKIALLATSLTRLSMILISYFNLFPGIFLDSWHHAYTATIIAATCLFIPYKHSKTLFWLAVGVALDQACTVLTLTGVPHTYVWSLACWISLLLAYMALFICIKTKKLFDSLRISDII